VETFAVPLLKTKGVPALNLPNCEGWASIDEIVEWFDVSREQITAVLEFVARSLKAPATLGR
jgi:hypothetical protein